MAVTRSKIYKYCLFAPVTHVAQPGILVLEVKRCASNWKIYATFVLCINVVSLREWICVTRDERSGIACNASTFINPKNVGFVAFLKTNVS